LSQPTPCDQQVDRKNGLERRCHRGLDNRAPSSISVCARFGGLRYRAKKPVPIHVWSSRVSSTASNVTPKHGKHPLCTSLSMTSRSLGWEDPPPHRNAPVRIRLSLFPLLTLHAVAPASPAHCRFRTTYGMPSQVSSFAAQMRLT
jgi:hypothetical protein